jgi:Domain of unknown function (DUF5615)
LRLLLDEMYPPTIAEQLRRRGHDAVAVTARPDLRMLADPDLFSAAQEEGRAVATENIADFITVADGYELRGRVHHGLVLLDPAKFPRGHPRTIGRMVTALHELLGAHPRNDATCSRHWL